MSKDLGSGYKYKKIKIKYPNGDVYEGNGAAYYSGEYEPYGLGTYYHKESGVTFSADWEYRSGPDFESIKIIDKPQGRPFVIIQAYAGEIYSDLVYLGIIKAKVGEYRFKDLPSFLLEPHAWSKHMFVIKQVNENELLFDFTGPKVDHGNFVNKAAKKGEPQELHHTVSSHIIWDHGDEYDVSQTARIKVLYF